MFANAKVVKINAVDAAPPFNRLSLVKAKPSATIDAETFQTETWQAEIMQTSFIEMHCKVGTTFLVFGKG